MLYTIILIIVDGTLIWHGVEPMTKQTVQMLICFFLKWSWAYGIR